MTEHDKRPALGVSNHEHTVDALEQAQAEIERLKAGILSALDEFKDGYEVSGIVMLEDLCKGGDRHDD